MTLFKIMLFKKTVKLVINEVIQVKLNEFKNN